jgi:hypothetical protein
MDSQQENASRIQSDRRKTPTSPWDAFRFGGRRMRNRRMEEHRQLYFVDRFPPATLILILSLLVLTLVDGVLTIHLLDADCQEANPIMEYLLGHGLMSFVIGKYILTAAGLPLLLVYKNYYLFGTPFRVGYLIPVFVGLYIILLCYQFGLLQGGFV